MKNLISVFGSLIFSLNLFGGILERSPLQYSIKETTVDNNLKDTEAAYMFTFVDKTIKVNATQIEYSIDGNSAFAMTNKSGSFEVKTTPGNHVFMIYVNDQYAEIYTDSIFIAAKRRIHIDLFLRPSSLFIICDKPVIYLYPPTEMKAKVEVVPNGTMTFTYPEYNNSWNVKAKPNGDLTIDNNTYNYLFWEAKIENLNSVLSQTEGFIVEGENASKFFEEKLSAFGFTSKEKADFITFWGPTLAKSKRNRVQFVFNEDCDHFATLTITPKPDHIARFYILFEPLDDSFSGTLIPQNISPMKRDGFTVLEWGGSKVTFENANL